MIIGINESKKLTKHASCKCKCNILVENVTQIKRGIAITVDVSVKIGQNIIHAKNIIFGTLPHILVKMVNISQVLFTIQ